MKIADMLASRRWYHRWEIAPGVFTPGQVTVSASRNLNNLGVPQDLRGLTAIDIGAWDGPLSFELERRGAKVTAADIQDPDRTGFNTAKAILGSSVEYVQTSVYDLSKLRRTFDLVFFCGVFYHLKHPILAFEEIGKASHAKTTLYFEGECLLRYAETMSGRWSPLSLLFRLMPNSTTPMCLSYPGMFRGSPNWFIPNLACLKVWLACGGFQMKSYRFNWPILRSTQRVYGSATRGTLAYMGAQEDGEIVEHGLT